MTEKSWYNSSPTLFVQSEGESCESFFANFFANTRHFLLRGTGGCGNLAPEYYHGLEKLKIALGGDPDDPKSPRVEGFIAFGGTRMIRKDDPTVIVPGITEVFPALKATCPNARILGIVVKAGILRTTPHGIIVSDGEEDPYVTIIHPDHHSTLLIQPSADRKADWNAEWQRVAMLCKAQAANRWKGLLTVYNGGGVTENELLYWADEGLYDPFYRVLLVNGSGGRAEKFAQNKKFLSAHPHVHVCENDISSMREKLIELDAIV